MGTFRTEKSRKNCKVLKKTIKVIRLKKGNEFNKNELTKRKEKNPLLNCFTRKSP